MITLEELQTYTQEELFKLKDMIGDILLAKISPMDDFFNNYLNAKDLQEVTVKIIYDKYQEYCIEKEITQLDKQTFYAVVNNLISKYNIELTTRVKEKIIKEKAPGIEVEKKEKQ